MPAPNERFDRASDAMPYKPQTRALRPYDIKIRPDWNPRTMNSRETRDNVESIKTSILQRINEEPPLPALQNPVEVTYERSTGETFLAHGECRLTACRELFDAGHDLYVDCKVAEGNEEQLYASNATGNGGTPLTQWELGIMFRRLNIGYRWSVDRIAAHACKSRRYVSEAIALSNVSADSKAMLAAGEVTPGAVLNAVKDHRGDQQAAASDLKQRVEEKCPAQKTLTGKSKPKPVTRPKKQSASEKIVKGSGKLLDLADAMCRLILDTKIGRDELKLAAEAYKEARGK